MSMRTRQSRCRWAVLLSIVLAQSGCGVGSPFRDPAGLAERLAAQAGFETTRVAAGRFSLTTRHRGLDGRSGRLTVYIEGDGYAWARRRRLSPDPTPRDPVALRLAIRDPAPAVLYIARPCQYLPDAPEASQCPSRYWSSDRYAEEVVAAVDEVISGALRGLPRQITLIGYSGGGAVAALVAARRPGVVSLVTVAGNLDHAFWTQLHQVTPLRGSLNPADFAAALAGLPQYHFVGGRDDNINRQVVESFTGRLGSGAPVKVIEIPEFDHGCCWAERWPQILADLRAASH